MTKNRLFPLTGVLAVVLTLGAHLCHGGLPKDDAPIATVAAYYRTHHTQLLVGALLLTYAAVALAAFGTALRREGAATTLGVVGAAVLATSFACIAWFSDGLTHHAKAVDPVALQAMHVLFYDMWAPQSLGGALLVFGSIGGALPRWLRIFGVVVGVVVLFPEPIGDAGLVAVGVWIAAASIVLAGREPQVQLSR